MSSAIKARDYSLAELIEAAEAHRGVKIRDMRFWHTANGFARCTWSDVPGKEEWFNPELDAVKGAKSLLGLDIVSAVFRWYDTEKVLSVVYVENTPGQEEKTSAVSLMLPEEQFKDRLTQLATKQDEISSNVLGLLDMCGFKSEEYLDWLDEYRLWHDGQLDRLVSMYADKLRERNA